VFPSKVLQKLRSGQTVHAAAVLPEPWNVELLGLLDYDCAWIDSEHNEMPDHLVSGLAIAGRASGIDTMVRIRKQSYADYFRYLEVGCKGVLVPHCDSAADAQIAVDGARFPPLGRRSLGGMGADAGYGLIPQSSYLSQTNQETFLAVQIECAAAVAVVDEIAAVPGVDILFVGPGDLCLDLGHPADFNHPDFRAALKRVNQAAKANGKWWGMPVGNTERLQIILDEGARFIVFGSAKSLLINGYKNIRATWKELSPDRNV
jgi:4-hydroxy-2-oxoheptanedioate aldolase